MHKISTVSEVKKIHIFKQKIFIYLSEPCLKLSNYYFTQRKNITIACHYFRLVTSS